MQGEDMTDREKFEAWAIEKGYAFRDYDDFVARPAHNTGLMWSAWQAARATAPTAGSAPVADRFFDVQAATFLADGTVSVHGDTSQLTEIWKQHLGEWCAQGESSRLAMGGLTDDRIRELLSATVTCTEDLNQPINLGWMRAFGIALLAASMGGSGK